MVTSRTHLKERAITAKPVTRGDASLTTIISEFCGDPLCIPRQFGLTVLTCPWLVTCGSVRSGSTGGGGDFGSYSFRVGYASWESGGKGGTFGRQVVTLRYSQRCKASWSRVTASAGGTAAVTKNVAFMNRYSSKTKRTVNGPGSVYSKMRSGKARACGTTNFNGKAVIETHCVSAR